MNPIHHRRLNCIIILIMSLFPLAAKPKSLLGYHRILSPTAGVRVSPLCLGAMNFGDAWKGMLGECDKATSFAIMDEFYENGGNFIDTGNKQTLPSTITTQS